MKKNNNKQPKTVDLNVRFRTPSGEIIGGEKAATVADNIGITLYQLHSLGGQPVDASKKYLAYKIATKVIADPSAVELSSEEKELIESVAAENFPAGIFGQLMEIINI